MKQILIFASLSVFFLFAISACAGNDLNDSNYLDDGDIETEKEYSEDSIYDGNGDGDFEDDQETALPPGLPNGTQAEERPSNIKSTTPYHEEAFNKVPEKVIIEFKEAITLNSSINVYANGKKVSLADMSLSEDSLALSISLDQNAGIGVFHILYKIGFQDIEEFGYFVFFVETRIHENTEIDSLTNFRENSIKGSQYVDLDDYKLEIAGLVSTQKKLCL